MKIKVWEGEIEVWEQEGGYCAPDIQIDGASVPNEISEFLGIDVKYNFEKAPGKWRITVEKIPQPTLEQTMNEIVTINGVEYAPINKGDRAIVVVDRGWIFAGDVLEKDGRILLTRAVWVFRWESVGFAGVIEDPSKADIRKIDNIDIPGGSEIFRVPVATDWGLENV